MFTGDNFPHMFLDEEKEYEKAACLARRYIREKYHQSAGWAQKIKMKFSIDNISNTIVSLLIRVRDTGTPTVG